MKITYLDKVAIQNDEGVEEINKVTDANMNEIKRVVNSNEDNQIEMKEELIAENKRLKADLNGLPKGTAEGENIYLTDSADMRFSSFERSGNSKQNGEPTPETPVDVKSCGDNRSINVVIHNKNLFNKDTIKQNYYVDSANGKFVSHSLNDISDYIKINSNYVVIQNAINNDTYALYDEDKVYIRGGSFKNNVAINTEGASWIVFTVKKTADTSKVQLEQVTEENATGTDYEEHQKQEFTIPNQQPMKSVGDIKDSFVKVNGKWFERHNVNRYELTGNESIYKHSSTSNNAYFFRISQYISSSLLTPISNNSYSYILCSHLKKETVEKIAFNNIIGIGLSKKNNDGTVEAYIGMGLNGISTVEELKTWLAEQYNAGTPVYVDYVLATSVDLECTPEQVAVLDEIDNTAKSYKGVTHIYSTDDVGPNIKVTYFKDIDIMINKLNTAIVALGGV